MTEFTASNGIILSLQADGRLKLEYPGDGSRGYNHTWAHPEDMVALREFFQHERDEALGRWRWPESPDYTVKPRSDGWMVLHEPTNHTELFNKRFVFTWPGTAMSDAVIAYFEAHPVKKPWEDANPGEVWVLDANEFSGPNVVEESSVFKSGIGFRHVVTGVRGPGLPAPYIKSARRIWPEPAA